MAYLHCHTCGWAQDDFWTQQYTPGRYFWRMLPYYLWPRWIWTDPPGRGRRPEWWRWRVGNHWGVVTTLMLLHETGRVLRKYLRQHWRTDADWKRAVWENFGQWPVCPYCGTNALDID